MIWLYYHPTARADYNDFWHLFKLFGYVLTFVNSCLNPIALYFISGVFRSYFKMYLCCVPRTRTVISSSMMSYRTTHQRQTYTDCTSPNASPLISRQFFDKNATNI